MTNGAQTRKRRLTRTGKWLTSLKMDRGMAGEEFYPLISDQQSLLARAMVRFAVGDDGVAIARPVAKLAGVRTAG